MHALDILQGQFSVIAEHFAQCDVNFLSLVCRQAEGKIAGEILGKLQHGFPLGVVIRSTGEKRSRSMTGTLSEAVRLAVYFILRAFPE